MNHNPIYKVLSILKKHNVKSLLIGGQATIAYGAAEFSRDIDLLIFLDKKNFKRLRTALKKLKAEQIYFPPLEIGYLQRGHACHFRCNLSEISGFRIDILANLRGCRDFNTLWERRKILKGPDNILINVISLQDLVQSKKTQRDKDWFMIKRLVEVDILNSKKVSKKRTLWWFMECIIPELLIELSKKYPDICKKNIKKRPLLKFALNMEVEKLRDALIKEERMEREKDKKFWLPLRKELECLRHSKTS